MGAGAATLAATAGGGTKPGSTAATSAMCSPRSVVESAGAGGAVGACGGSQSHRAHVQPGCSVGVSVRGCSAQHGEVAAPRQQDRFEPAGQHDFATGRACGAGFCSVEVARAGMVQAHARTGTTAPIAVETATSRQTRDRAPRAKDMLKSYTRPSPWVNAIRAAALLQGVGHGLRGGREGERTP